MCCENSLTWTYKPLEPTAGVKLNNTGYFNYQEQCGAHCLLSTGCHEELLYKIFPQPKGKYNVSNNDTCTSNLWKLFAVLSFFVSGQN